MFAPLIKNLKKITPLYKLYQFAFHKNFPDQPGVSIPDFDTKRRDISAIADTYKYVDVFVETGTLFGETIEFFKNRFARLYSIELSEELAGRAIKKFSADDKIKIIQGNSSEQLKLILEGISSPCLFWLDGHYSGEFSTGKEFIKTAKGNKVTPIMKELKHIADHSITNHVILIDDARLFIGYDDYPTLSKVKKFVSKKFPGHTFEIKNDIIRICPINLVHKREGSNQIEN